MKVKYLITLVLIIISTNNLFAASNDNLSEAVTHHYVELAKVRYLDAKQAAESLQQAVLTFIDKPSEETHITAKQAWKLAHDTYSLTEVFRFGNPNVDAWEDDVNAWPIDEGLIDYVDHESYEYDNSNPFALENIVAGTDVIDITFLEALRSGKDFKDAPMDYMGVADIEANVVTGYHAIEFLLWGQDLNETPQSEGKRSYTDYLPGENCTNGHCKRRAQFLNSLVRILVRDLEIILNDWSSDSARHYANAFSQLSVNERLNRIITGMGSLSYGELAGERIRTAMLAGHQEEEQSCFSDMTHYAIYQNALSIQTLYLGTHTRIDGTTFDGPSLSELVEKYDASLDEKLKAQLEDSMQAALRVVNSADQGNRFDLMIQSENEQGRKLLSDLIASLRAQTETIEQVQKNIDALASL